MDPYNEAINDAMAVCDEFIAENRSLHSRCVDQAPWDKQLFLGAYKTAENIKEWIEKLKVTRVK